MDKKLNRQIGFRSDRKIATVNHPKWAKPLIEQAVKEKKEKDVPKQIVAWINERPLFKWSGMCRELGIDPSNFSRILQSTNPVIGPEMMAKILPVLREYGFSG